MIEIPYDYYVKLVMVGDSSVGKSSVMMRYAHDSYGTYLPATIGRDFKVKHIVLVEKRIKLLICDTAGQERFREQVDLYFPRNNILIMYDITDRVSFLSVRSWMVSVQSHASVDAVKILLGTKCDLTAKRCVTISEGDDLAREFNMPFYEMSALRNINIEKVFLCVAEVELNSKVAMNNTVNKFMHRIISPF
jgi:small GTP-binding protein